MKRKYIIGALMIMAVGLIIGYVVADPLSGRNSFGTIQFSTSSKLPKQTIGMCEIGKEIVPHVDIIYMDEKKEELNYTLRLRFDGYCIQGMDGKFTNQSSRYLDYSGKTYKEAIKDDIIIRFNKEFNEKTVKVIPKEPVIKGKYN